MVSLFQSQDLKNKRVFLRTDLNTDDTTNTHKLESIMPTLDHLCARGAKIILATHLGRPEHQEKELSTQKLLPWFAGHHYPIVFEPSLEKAYEKSFTDPNTIVLLENLRFSPAEQSPHPEERKKYAQQLARLADFYVNDAFGTLHRNDTSLTDLPLLFSPDTRSLGPLVIKELTQLHDLFLNPHRPFLAFFGGNKMETKITVMKHLIPKLDTIALCPALVFSFLHYQKKPVGISVVDNQSFNSIKEIFTLAKQYNVTILFPLDYLVTSEQHNGQLCEINADDFPANAQGISIGPKTAALYIKKIKESKTILYNGLSGFLDKPETMQYTYEIFNAMNNAPARTIIAGGDCVTAAIKAGYTKNISYLSTGGGATLAYIGKEHLPGLDAFKHQAEKII